MAESTVEVAGQGASIGVDAEAGIELGREAVDGVHREAGAEFGVNAIAKGEGNGDSVADSEPSIAGSEALDGDAEVAATVGTDVAADAPIASPGTVADPTVDADAAVEMDTSRNDPANSIEAAVDANAPLDADRGVADNTTESAGQDAAISVGAKAAIELAPEEAEAAPGVAEPEAVPEIAASAGVNATTGGTAADGSAEMAVSGAKNDTEADPEISASVDRQGVKADTAIPAGNERKNGVRADVNEKAGAEADGVSDSDLDEEAAGSRVPGATSSGAAQTAGSSRAPAAPAAPAELIGSLAGLSQDQLRSVLDRLESSDVNKMESACGEILGSPAGESEKAVAVCRVFDVR